LHNKLNQEICSTYPKKGYLGRLARKLNPRGAVLVRLDIPKIGEMEIILYDLIGI
jgi:hypothetical protein